MKNCFKTALMLICAIGAVSCSSSKKEPEAATAQQVTETQEALETNDYQTIVDMIYSANYKGAIQLATEVMDRDGKSVDALTLRGIANAKMGMPYPAYADLLEAVKMDRNVDTLINLGNALRMNGLCDRSLDAYKQALALSPNNPEILINMTNAYICLDDTDNANTLIQMTLADFPGDAVSYTNVAIMKHILEQHDEARRAAEMAIAADPYYRPAYQALYRICISQKDNACRQEAERQHNMLRGQIFRTNTTKRTIK